MRYILLFIAAVLAQPAHSQEDPHRFVMPGTSAKTIPAPAPWFTGAELLRLLDQRDAEAGAYLKGVFDATESGLWCYTDRRHVKVPKQSTDTLRADTVAYLRRLPRAKLQERAAVLVVEMWQERWPCPPDGCCF